MGCQYSSPSVRLLAYNFGFGSCCTLYRSGYLQNLKLEICRTYSETGKLGPRLVTTWTFGLVLLAGDELHSTWKKTWKKKDVSTQRIRGTFSGERTPTLPLTLSFRVQIPEVSMVANFDSDFVWKLAFNKIPNLNATRRLRCCSEELAIHNLRHVQIPTDSGLGLNADGRGNLSKYERSGELWTIKSELTNCSNVYIKFRLFSFCSLLTLTRVNAAMVSMPGVAYAVESQRLFNSESPHSYSRVKHSFSSKDIVKSYRNKYYTYHGDRTDNNFKEFWCLRRGQKSRWWKNASKSMVAHLWWSL